MKKNDEKQKKMMGYEIHAATKIQQAKQSAAFNINIIIHYTLLPGGALVHSSSLASLPRLVQEAATTTTTTILLLRAYRLATHKKQAIAAHQPP
jgi:hypothetical protein